MNVQQVLLEQVEAVGLNKIVRDNAMGFWIGVRAPCDNGTATIALGIVMLMFVFVFAFDFFDMTTCMFSFCL